MTTSTNSYHIAFFHNVTQVLRAERMLLAAHVPHKIIPIPRQISSDCGVCVRFESDCADEVKLVLTQASGLSEFREITTLLSE